MVTTSAVEVSEASQNIASEGGQQPPIPKQFLTKPELAAALGVSPRTIENWIAEKRIPRLQLSARLARFDLSRVVAALSRYEVREVGATR